MTFFDQYSFKVKNRALLGLIGLMCLLLFKKVYYETLESRKVLSEIQTKIKANGNTNKTIRVLQRQLFSINKYLGVEEDNPKKTQQQFLLFFNDYSKNIEIESVSEVIVYNHPDFKINTFKIELKGTFKFLVQFIFALEMHFDFGRVVSTSFETRVNYQTNLKSLYSTIIIQNYSL